MRLLRTEETHNAYEDHKKRGILNDGCVLCKASSTEEFSYWRIIKNIFPYDRIADTHDMVIPKRHTDEAGLTAKETTELADIKKKYIGNNYHFILEATTGIKSIPEHFHLHLITIKEEGGGSRP